MRQCLWGSQMRTGLAATLCCHVLHCRHTGWL